MSGFFGGLRKLVLGETWILPAGVALAVASTAGLRWLSGPDGWFHQLGGAVLLGLLVLALTRSLRGFSS